MSENMQDYWPEDITPSDDPEPVKLLKEQAELLGRRTRGLVRGVVRTLADQGTVYYSLYLESSGVGDYMFKILHIAHPVSRSASEPFPITAQDSFGGDEVKLGDVDAFRQWLKSVLSSEEVKTVIKNLMRQSSPVS